LEYIDLVRLFLFFTYTAGNSYNLTLFVMIKYILTAIDELYAICDVNHRRLYELHEPIIQ